MSRSVTMPGPGWSGSITTAAPTPRSDIAFAAAWRSEWPGPTVSTTLLIPSRTRNSTSSLVPIGAMP